MNPRARYLNRFVLGYAHAVGPIETLPSETVDALRADCMRYVWRNRSWLRADALAGERSPELAGYDFFTARCGVSVHQWTAHAHSTTDAPPGPANEAA